MIECKSGGQILGHLVEVTANLPKKENRMRNKKGKK